MLAAMLAGSIVLAGCSWGDQASSPGAAGQAGQAGGGGSKAAVVAITPADGAAKVGLTKPIKVTVSKGTLSTVTVTSKQGQTLKGTLSDDKLSWTSRGRLAANTTYQVTVQAASADGKPASRSASFTTLTPKGTVTAAITPSDGWNVGVGMPVIVNFSRSVSTANRPAVEAALKVNTDANIEGSWRWFSSQQVQWRPAVYWPSNAKVNVTADLSGVEIQPGLYGSTTERSSDFTIGSAVISTVDVSGHSLTMRKDGKVVRTIPVTTGKASMATRNGIKVIMSRETSHRMVSSTIGIKKGTPGYYDILTKYAMRLTYSGEFLHAAPWSTGSQGSANVSHGCTGMSTANAKWLFDHSKVGDVVVYKHSTRKLEWGNGYTAWDMSYAKWRSA